MFLLIACAEPDVVVKGTFDSGAWIPPADSGDTDSGTVPVDTAHTGDTTDTPPDDTAPVDTGPDDTEPPPWWDCDALPDLPTDDTELTAGTAFRDLVFDDDGRLLGSDLTSLIAATYEGDEEVVMPLQDAIYGMVRMLDGDIAAQGALALYRVTLDGAWTPLAPILSGYGVTQGPDGMLYASDGHDIDRVDPADGARETWLTIPTYARGAVFSVDNSRAFIAATGGSLYAVDLDADLNPVGDPAVFVTLGGTQHDALSIDACDNVYVAEYSDRSLKRVAPDSTVTVFYSGALSSYGHGIEFGSGLGGWREDALYLAQPYDNNTVRELVIGVPSAETVRARW